jgi:uracil-DNA glycosylase family protein
MRRTEAPSDTKRKLDAIRRDAIRCRDCELWQCGTQTVFGEGAPDADVMFVGEQPGDREDRAGHPFVGPAGQLLDRALDEAGIDRSKTYVTNAVKHFRWEARGKRRIHKKPSGRHIKACHPWLEEEIATVRPKLIVALGATAAQALLGSDFRVTKHRGEVIRRDGLPPVTATVHPSSILRADDDSREQEFDRFVGDLRTTVSAQVSP